ncbi:MAG: DNA-binding protein [Spirochaetes bacterium]|nr:MAG: DNA-binding protein [Spirochaetota bacterium]
MSTQHLIRTGEAAERLGVSRQHVVDLCESGQLDFVRVGTHRRVMRESVEAMVAKNRGWRSDGHQRSLALHALIVGKLMSDREHVVEVAKRNLEKRHASRNEPYTREWERLLDGPVPVLVFTMLDPSSKGTTLKSCTPFTGLLSEKELADVNAAYRKGCQGQAGGDGA